MRDDDTTTNPASDRSGRSGISRRALLGGLGVATAAVAAPSVARASERRGGRDGSGRDRAAGDPGPSRFDRAFPGLAPFAAATPEVREALVALGAPGGIMDGGFEAVENVPENPDHASLPAGYTFVGQFLDHDLTRDAGSPLGRPTGLDRSTNLRTARFDLDSVYGRGPVGSPELYEAGDRFRLRVESGGRFEDLPRDEAAVAFIGDDRNDENLIVSQLHTAYLAFHNAVLDRVRAAGRRDQDAFDEARRLVRWHHQWIVVHDVLPRYVGATMARAVLDGDVRTPAGRSGRIPVEFSTAAYRFGHSIVRPGYRVNTDGNADGSAFAAPIFDASSPADAADPEDLSGGHRAPRRFVDWAGFFDFGDNEPTVAKRMDTKLSGPLMNLPVRVVDSGRGEGPGPTSLAARNLLRHLTWDIPSGQAVAEAIGAPTLAPSDLADLEPFGAGLVASTPLFFYVLREADRMADGEHLGPVGGRLVAEVFVALLRNDRRSFLSQDPTWTPTLPMRDPGAGFTMADLVTVAGMDPATRASGAPPATTADADPASAQAAAPPPPAGGARPARRGDEAPRPPRPPRDGASRP